MTHTDRRASLFRHLAASGGIDQAVETGTWQGYTTRLLSEIFDEVVTVELLPDIHAAAVAKNTDLHNVDFRLGESGKVLSDLAGERGSKPAVFYLDAHCGSFYTKDEIRPRRPGEPATPEGTATQCPLTAELSAIDSWPAAQRCCILIDDARVFLGPHPGFRREDWPAFIEVVDDLRRHHDRFVTVLDDMIIAVPADQRSTVEDWWLEEGSPQAYDPPSLRLALGGLKRAAQRQVKSVLGRGRARTSIPT